MPRLTSSALLGAMRASGTGRVFSGTPQLMNLRNDEEGPDEFAVLPTAPLEIPAENLAALPEPTPGARNRVDPDPEATRSRRLAATRAAASGAGDLVSYATRFGVSGDIRPVLAAEDEEFRRRNDGRSSNACSAPTSISAPTKPGARPVRRAGAPAPHGRATPAAPPRDRTRRLRPRVTASSARLMRRAGHICMAQPNVDPEGFDAARCCSLAIDGFAPADGAGAENVTEFFLDNGMQVVVIEDHRSPAVTHMVWYRVGAADEPPGQSGHRAFPRTPDVQGHRRRRKRRVLPHRRSQRRQDNAFTSWDYTGYFQRVAADRLGLMMEMEADRMRDLRFADEEVVTERSVILEERASARFEPRRPVQRTDARRAVQQPSLRHPDHRLAHEMEGLDREDALDFYDAHYCAQQRHPDRRRRRHARRGARRWPKPITARSPPIPTDRRRASARRSRRRSPTAA
jgi:hypothetical protein